MRMHQWYGLNERGEKWIKENVAKKDVIQTATTIYPDGKWEFKTWESNEPIIVSSKTVEDAFGGGIAGHLHVYELPNGNLVEEYIQAEPWSSGPMTFVALRSSDGHDPIKETLWQDSDPETEGQL